MNNKREYWLDYLRGLACIMVVALHTVAPYLYRFTNNNPSIGWHLANVIDSFTRVCVPLFFMISGYLFFRERTPKVHNFTRLAMTILFYGIIAISYLLLTKQPYEMKLAKIIYAPPFYHLWFLYTILTIYLFSFAIKIRDLTPLSSIVFITMIFIILNPRSLNYLNQDTFNGKEIAFNDGSDLYFLSYALAGALIGDSIRKLTPSRPILKISLIFTYTTACLFIYVLTYISSNIKGKFVATHYEYNGPLVFIAATSFFLLFTLIRKQFNKVIHKSLLLFSSLSLPIYGIHALILDMFWKNGFRDYTNPYFDIPFIFISTLILSGLIAYGIKFMDKKKLVT